MVEKYSRYRRLPINNCNEVPRVSLKLLKGLGHVFQTKFLREDDSTTFIIVSCLRADAIFLLFLPHQMSSFP